jgi:hypothetical protein
MNFDQLRLEIETFIRNNPELEEDDVLRADMLEGATDIKEALALLFRKADDRKLLADAVTLRIDELIERRLRFTHSVEVTRELILKLLQAANLKKVELAEATLSQRATQPQIIGTVDPDLLPNDLVRTKREANRTAVREALLAGRVIPGLSLSNAAPSLMIKSK